jgi:uncharacterized membrane protein
MNTKMLLAALGGTVANFLLGWLVYGILLMDFYQANTIQYEGLMYEMPNLFLVFLSNFTMAFLFAYIYQVWAGIKSFGKGFTTGLLLGFLIMFTFDLYFVAGMNLMSTTLVIVDILVSTIMTGIMAGVVAWILGTGNKV